MRIISFGDLYLDYYFKNDELIGICGGKTNANIIANLSNYFSCAFLGVCGNDKKGNIAISSLEKLNVDISNIERISEETKTLFMNEKGYTSECPYCHRDIGYHGSKIKGEYILPLIKQDDFIVVDNLNVQTLNILSSIDNPAFIDLGYVNSIMYKSLDELVEMLANRFKIINLNERVYDFIKRKFAIDSMDLYTMLNPDILIITRGKRGADIIVQNEFFKKEVDLINEVETSGAGDAFFAEFIRTYIEIGEANEKMISKAFIRAQARVSEVLSHIGARTHLEPLYKIKDYKECICATFNIEN